MDHRAYKNILDGLRKVFVDACAHENGMFGDGIINQAGAVAARIAKQKSEWISEDAALLLIIDSVMEMDERFSNDINASRSMSLDERVQQVGELVKGIPYNYDVYFDLGGLMDSSAEKISLEYSGLYFFGLQSSRLIRPTLSTILGIGSDFKPVTCLKLNMVGYCDASRSCLTSLSAVGRLKVFLILALYAKLFTIFPWEFSPKPKLNFPDSPMSFVKVSDAVDPTAPTPRKVSRDISSLLQRIQLVDNQNAAALDVKLQQLSSGFETLFRSDYPVLKKIRAACEWSFDALAEESPAMSIVKVCIGLETMFGDDNSEVGVTKTLVDRCSYFLASSFDERLAMANDLTQLYRLRSKIVHGVRNSLISTEQRLLSRGHSLLEASIVKEMKFLQRDSGL